MTGREGRDAIRPYTTPYNDAYGTCERTKAELLVYAGEMPPAEVTKLLGMEPTQSIAKGEKKTNSIGRVRVGKYNCWFLSSETHVQSMDLRRHLDWLIAKLQPVGQQLLALQRVDGVFMKVSCAWWSKHNDGGPTVWPEHMRALADLNLEFTIGFWYPGNEEDRSPSGFVQDS